MKTILAGFYLKLRSISKTIVLLWLLGLGGGWAQTACPVLMGDSAVTFGFGYSDFNNIIAPYVPNIVFNPVTVTSAMTLDNVQIESGSVGSVLVGIYASNQFGDEPNFQQLLYNSPAPVTINSGLVTLPVPPLTLTPGIYWVGVEASQGETLGTSSLTSGLWYYTQWPYGVFPTSGLIPFVEASGYYPFVTLNGTAPCPTNTPTATSVNTPGPSPTETSTLPPTASATNTPTNSATATATNSPTCTATQTATNTATATASLTTTATHTLSPTASMTVTFSPTPSPTATCVSYVWPDPYDPRTAVGGTLRVSCLDAQSTVSLFTVSGEKVQTLNYQTSTCVVPNMTGMAYCWNGLNSRGMPVAPGIYFYVIQQGTQVTGRGKFLVVKRNGVL